ncbi:MAG TPA: PP0621 family protein [Paucimonas sp.]|nr:PP0621 family protein [Paucimonas sp.]
MKFLLWIGLFVLVYLALRHKSRIASRDASARSNRASRAGTTEPMLQCRQCGVHFPASEATRNALGDAFCCEEHLRVHGSH